MYYIISWAGQHTQDCQLPTYGELIDLFEEVEKEHFNDENVLCQQFKDLYPDVTIGRPRRFFETVKRLIAPVRPSLRGTVSLTGSALASYRRRVWVPRVRNAAKGIIHLLCNGLATFLFCYRCSY